MRPDVARALDRIAAAARADGIQLMISSGFRTDAEQARVFAARPDPRWVARPGQSLHRLGTELDLGPSSAYSWLADHARAFTSSSATRWEPWHYGRPVDRARCPGDTRRSMPDPEQREARPDFADRRGMIGPYGVRYSWAFWLVILAAFALLVVDIVDDRALWNYLVIVLVVIAIVIQPGGIHGPRHAARAEEKRPRV